MKKTTAAITLVGSFLALGLFATAHGSGYGSGYYERGSRYEYRGGYGGRDYDDRYAYRGNGRYYDDSRYEYRGDGRYYDDSRYEYRGNGRRPMPAPARTPADTGTAPTTTNN